MDVFQNQCFLFKFMDSFVLPRFRINWGDGDAPPAGEGEVEGGEAGTNGEAAGPGLVVCQDTDR